MSTLTPTKKSYHLAELAENYFADQEKQRAAAAKTAARHKKFHDELRKGIDFYNTVVMNTARKFSSDISTSGIYTQLALPTKAEFKHINPHTGEYIFELSGKKYIILSELLRGDPIAIAQHTRKHIRALQDKKRVEEFNKTKTAKEKAQREFRAAERALKTAEAKFEEANKRVEFRTELITKRLEKKIHDRNVAAEKKKLEQYFLKLPDPS